MNTPIVSRSTSGTSSTSFKWAAIALASLTLMACGGVSSDPAAPTANPAVPEVTPTPAPTPSPTPSPTPTPTPPATTSAIPQGIWQSAAGAAVTTSAVVTQDGQVWSVLTTAATTGSTGTTPSPTASTTRLLKANLAATTSGAGFSGTGKVYLLGATTTSTTSTSESVTLNATAVTNTSLSGTITGTIATTTGASPQAEPFSLAYQSRYDTPATLASFVGSAWTATLGAGTLNWSIDSTGKISGTRTTGCTYTGQISLRTEAKAVADVAITESCPAVTQMSGVALKSPDNAGITMLLTTTGDAQGVVIGLK